MTKSARYLYLIFSTLFLIGVLTQVFFAGMSVVARQWGWDNHISLGHGLALPLLLMLVTAYLGRLPGATKRLNWALFVVYIIQADVIIFLRTDAPVISAFHPVLALVDFALIVAIVRQAWGVLRQADQPESQAAKLGSPLSI